MTLCYWDLENQKETLLQEIATLEDLEGKKEHLQRELVGVEQEMENWCPYCLEKKEDHSCLCREAGSSE